MLCVYRSQPSGREKERERVRVKAEPPLASNASPEQQGRRRDGCVCSWHFATRERERASHCACSKAAMRFSRALHRCRMCSILDMPFAVSVVDYDGSLRYVARGKRGKWQVKEIDSIDDTLFFAGSS